MACWRSFHVGLAVPDIFGIYITVHEEEKMVDTVHPTRRIVGHGLTCGTKQCAGGWGWIDRPQRGHNMLAHGSAVGSLEQLHLPSVKTTLHWELKFGGYESRFVHHIHQFVANRKDQYSLS
jgi:hypothetical protein